MARPTKRIVVDSIDVGQMFQFHRMLRAITLAMQPPRLVAGLLMVVALAAAGHLYDLATPNNIHEEGVLVNTMPFAAGDIESGLAEPVGTYAATVTSVSFQFKEIVRSTWTLDVGGIINGFANLFIEIPSALWATDQLFVFIYGLVFLLVVAIGGGALSRMAACEMAGSERLEIRRAFAFSVANWRPLVLAPLLPLLLAGFAGGLLMLLGILMFPWVDVIGGLAYGVALIIGLFITLLLIAYVLCFHLLIPAVAVENCDAIDAQQRAYAYLLSRPLHFVLYCIMAIIGVAIGFGVIGVVATLLLNGTAALYGAIPDNPAMTAAGGFQWFEFSQPTELPDYPAWHQDFAANMITFWQTVVVSLVGAYVFAFYFAATTIMYLLMRRVCDGQPTTDIWRPGLIPGTLAPLPEPIVIRAGETSDEAEPEEHMERAGHQRASERFFDGLLRTFTAVRHAWRPTRHRTKLIREMDLPDDKHDVDEGSEDDTAESDERSSDDRDRSTD